MSKSACPKVFIYAFFGIFACASAAAETHAQTDNLTDQLNADETIELNIAQERITENDFSRSTEVRLGSEKSGGVRVEIGVGAKASRIDVLLRGVYGRATFRASLEALKQRIEQRRQRLSPAAAEPNR
jgi:hypothetical protein